MQEGNNNSAVALVDIDDMWAHTTRKFGKNVGDPLVLGEACVFDEAGAPVSYRSVPQRGMLELLLQSARVVPCTGRSVAKYKRVRLGFTDYAITSFGGVILTPEGQPEPGWHSVMSAEAALEAGNMQSMLAYAQERARAIAAEDLGVELICDVGLDLVIKVQSKAGVQANLDELAAGFREAAPTSWKVHLNDGQLSAFPSFLGKVRACQYFLENLAGEPTLVIGAGDSLSDLNFMGLCHYMVAPVKSQIFRHLAQSATDGE